MPIVTTPTTLAATFTNLQSTAPGDITTIKGVLGISGGGSGTVTSVNITGGTTGLTASGGPVTTSGTFTLGGTLAIANGGTGATTASTAAAALLPSQTGNSGKFLTTDGSGTLSWGTSSGYTLPTASTTVLGGVKVDGTTITISSGIISAASGGSNFVPNNTAGPYIGGGQSAVSFSASSTGSANFIPMYISATDLHFAVGSSSSVNEILTLTTGGKIGIGTMSPGTGTLLDIQSTTLGVRFPNMTATQKNAITPALGTVVYDTTNSALNVYTGSWTALGSGGGGGVTSFNSRTGAVTLTSGDVTSVVSLGTMSSQNSNSVSISGGSATLSTLNTSSTVNIGGTLNLYGGATTIQSIASIGSSTFTGMYPSATLFQFATGSTPSASLMIDSNQFTYCGYTSSQGSYRLQVNGQIFATSSTIATSDARYKENVVSIDDGLDVINSLNPVTFNWKEHPVHSFAPGTTTGFIAQEVEIALAGKPYLNSVVKNSECTLEDGTKEDFKGIAEGNFISLLVSAVKTLSSQVNALRAEVDALKAS